MSRNSWQVRSSTTDSRRAERMGVTIKAGLREHGTQKFEVKVTDLSITGFRCETSFTLSPGTRVWLTIPGLGGLESVVAWRDRFTYGLRFEQALHPAVLKHVTSQFLASN